MSSPTTRSVQSLTLRYWAAARAAAGGTATEQIEVTPGATVREVLTLASNERPELAKVIAASTFLIDGRTVDGSTVVPTADGPGPGIVLEVLPPFAGG